MVIDVNCLYCFDNVKLFSERRKCQLPWDSAVNNMVLVLHLQRKATRACMRDGIMDGSENYFDALQVVKERAEMCRFKAHLIRS